MKFSHLVTTFSLMAASHSYGAAGIYDSFIFTTTTGSAPLTFYDIGAVTTNPDFQDRNLGVFQPTDTLRLGGQEKSYKNNGSDVTSHSLLWRVWLTSNGASGSFASVNMPFQWNKGTIGAPSGLTNDGDQQWGGDVQGNNATLTLSTNVIPIPAGAYTLEVYSQITTNSVDAANPIGNVNGGANYRANFTVVPEPSSAPLGLIGSLLLLRRRRSI